MKVCFNFLESKIVHDFIGEVAGDIIIKLDNDGFIIEASSGASELGVDYSSGFLLPHITDLAQHSYIEFVSRYVKARLAGGGDDDWIEFPLAGRSVDLSRLDLRQRWYALRLRPILDTVGAVQGALGIIRSVQQLRDLEDELFEVGRTDQLTGLENRQSFHRALQRCLAAGSGGTLAVVAVDGMNALRLRYGTGQVDDLLCGFARFLETMAQPNYRLAFLGDRFGVLLPRVPLRPAREWSEDLVRTFGALSATGSSSSPALSLSAGVVPICGSEEQIISAAEVSLVLARAGGGGRVVTERYRVAA